MILFDSFKKLNKHLTLLLVPIVYDLFALVTGLLLIGFNGERGISIRMLLEMGIPSTSDLSNIALFTNNIEFLNYKGTLSALAPLVIIIVVMGRSLLQGGYISYLSHIVKEQAYSVTTFFNDSVRHWIQFVLLDIIVFLLKIAMSAFLAIFFGVVGIFASLVFMITLRIIFIYLEFSIVIDNTSVWQALKKSRKYFMASIFSTFGLIILMFILSSSLSFVLHYYWSLVLVMVMIFIYSYVMSWVELALMSTLHTAKRGNKIIS